MCRQHPDYEHKQLNIFQSVPEAALKSAVHSYNQIDWLSSYARDEGAMIKKASADAKSVWLSSNFYRDFTSISSGRRVNVMGTEFTKIILPLKESCTFYISASCACSKRVWSYSQITAKFTVKDLQVMSRNNLRVDQSLQIPYAPLSDVCSKCASPSRIDYVFVPDTTWFLYFDFEKFQTEPSHDGRAVKAQGIPTVTFDIDLLPKEINVHELTRTGQLATFYLGYVAMRSTVEWSGNLHHSAWMRLNDKWFYYNDIDQESTLYEEIEVFNYIKAHALDILGVFYFRKPTYQTFR